MGGLFAIVPRSGFKFMSILTVLPHSNVVVLEESPCPRRSSRTNFEVLVLVLIFESQVLDNNKRYFSLLTVMYHIKRISNYLTNML